MFLVCLGNTKHLVIATQITFNHSYTLQTKPKALFVSIVRNKKELQFYTPIISLALEEFGKKGKGTPYSINFNLFWNTIDFSGQEN